MLPVVQKETLQSIGYQMERDTKFYVQKMLQEIVLENPNLAKVILNFADTMASKHGQDDIEKYQINIEFLCAGLSVYQSLKQQVVCDELKEDENYENY